MDPSVLTKIKSKSGQFFGLSHHDRFHTERVYNLAVQIAEREQADLDVVRAAALLHDIARALEDEGKIADHAAEGARMARAILEDVGFPKEKIPQVIHCVEVHRFRNAFEPKSLEAKILQDADRLDIIGAIGIARVFTRGGWGNKSIHDPAIPPKEQYNGRSVTSVNHLYEKILKVKNTFNTTTAKRLAEERHRFTEEFLDRLLNEWKAEI